jgi:hypothetical protein
MSCINVLRMGGLYRANKTVLVTQYGFVYAAGWWRAQCHPERAARGREVLKRVSQAAERIAPLCVECSRSARLNGRLTVARWDGALARIDASLDSPSRNTRLQDYLIKNRIFLPVVDTRIVPGRADYVPRLDVVGRAPGIGRWSPPGAGSRTPGSGVLVESAVGSMNSTGVGSMLSDEPASRGTVSETAYSPSSTLRSIGTSTVDLDSTRSISETHYSPSGAACSTSTSTTELALLGPPSGEATVTAASVMRLLGSRVVRLPPAYSTNGAPSHPEVSPRSSGASTGSTVSSFRSATHVFQAVKPNPKPGPNAGPKADPTLGPKPNSKPNPEAPPRTPPPGPFGLSRLSAEAAEPPRWLPKDALAEFKRLSRARLRSETPPDEASPARGVPRARTRVRFDLSPAAPPPPLQVAEPRSSRSAQAGEGHSARSAQGAIAASGIRRASRMVEQDQIKPRPVMGPPTGIRADLQRDLNDALAERRKRTGPEHG